MSMLPWAATSRRCGSEAITAMSITIASCLARARYLACVPGGRAEPAQEAVTAAGQVSGAGGAAEEEEQEMRRRQAGAVAEHRGHGRVPRGGGERPVVAGQAEAAGDAEQVGIDRQRLA